ncbi:MAG TPA: ABC transporter permease, partial [Terriglobia bacterium]|nr:ABC transporter permease [Terriglobia bacterium]
MGSACSRDRDGPQYAAGGNMTILSRLRALTHFLLRRSEVEGEMEEEFRSHLRRRAQDLERQGLSRAEAEREARREFGGYQSYKEECREALGTRLLGEFIADARFGRRQLRRNPGFTIGAVLTLALGIGANTAVFSLVDEVWLRPRPVPHPERVVRIYTSNPTSGSEISSAGSSYLDYDAISRGGQSFSGVACLQMRGAMIDTQGESKLVDAAVVSDNFFDVLAPGAAAGHLLTAAAASAPGTLAVMLSHPFWSDHFNADPSLPGKTVILDGRHVVVAGILPRGFRGTEPTVTPNIWIPLSTWGVLTGERPTPESGSSNPFDLFGRLRPGVPLAQANAELAVIAARLARERPQTNAGGKMMCLGESQVQGEGLRGFSLILLAISGLVLLLACANVASLLIARAELRRHEFVMRAALGAGRRRLLRQLLTEAALLGAAATAGALLIGMWVDAVLPKVLPQIDLGATTPIDAHMTTRVLWFSLGAGLLSVFAFGGIPATQGSAHALAGALKQQGRGVTARAPVRSVLVVVQVAISLVLVVAAGLLVRSLMNAEAADPGFDAHQNMLVLDFAADFRTDQAYRAFVGEARRGIESTPGVLGTAVAMRIPFGLSGSGATLKVFFAGATGRAATDG